MSVEQQEIVGVMELTMKYPIRIAVIGVGHMGRNHVRLLANMEDVELVAIADIDRQRAESIAHFYSAKGYIDPLALLKKENLDAVSICTPAVSHCTLALEVAKLGIHILVEKPIATSVKQGQSMVEAAKKSGVILMVGQIERFNPVVLALRNRILSGELGHIFQIETRRTSPEPKRVSDAGVLLDLAVHDLDVMRYITNSEVKRVYAEIDRRNRTIHEDQVIGLLRFINGAIGKISVNWLTSVNLRELAVIGEYGTFMTSNVSQDLVFYENTATNGERKPVTRYAVPKQDCLQAELEAFVSAVRNGNQSPVSGQDGIATLTLTEALIKSGEEQRVVKINTA